MWRVSSALIGKDLSLLFVRGSGLVQALLLGLLLIFVFSLSSGPGDQISPQTAATIFWVSSLFCQVLIFNQLYALEENHGQRLALLLLPVMPQTIWLAKSIAGFLLLLTAQICFLPACLIFLGQMISEHFFMAICGLVLVDIGISALGSLLGAVAQGQAARESLLSILLFPLLTPLLLAGISLHTASFGGAATDLDQWLMLASAFDAIFVSVSFVLFAFIYTGDES
ncbi:MAG: heme exporter protein CcmB [Desulfovibrio sp.]|nr:heme exporter protein CcmB [Desulfovibrio sp.]